MKALTSPIVYILLSVLLGAGLVLALLNKEATTLVTQMAAQHVHEIEAKRPEKPWDFWTPEVENLAKELKEEKEKLAQREADVAAREKRVAAEVLELDVIRKQVESLRGEIASRIVEVQSQEMKNLKTLANTYSKLTPPAAVAIFKELDDLMVAKLLSLMKPEVTTAILQEFSSTPGPDNVNVKRAAEITQRLRLLVQAKP